VSPLDNGAESRAITASLLFYSTPVKTLISPRVLAQHYERITPLALIASHFFILFFFPSSLKRQYPSYTLQPSCVPYACAFRFLDTFCAFWSAKARSSANNHHVPGEQPCVPFLLRFHEEDDGASTNSPALPQRLRGAIDRTIAEEQARQKPTDGTTPSRSGSTSSRRSDGNPAARRPRAKKPSADITDTEAPNPDPAVFEAAFVIDDSDDPSRSGTPAPPAPPEKDNIDGNGMATTKGEQPQQSQANGTTPDKDRSHGKAADDGETTTPAPAAELSPEIKQRLRKLEKLESTYPGMRQFCNRTQVLPFNG
jgi:hypothetical protein